MLDWFGKASENERNSPERANFKFDFYWIINNADKIPTNDKPRYRIGIDQATGIVERGNLQVIEASYQQGQCVEFSGIISAQLTQDKAQLAEKWLDKAAHYIPAIGALKGSGFGRIKGVSLESSVRQAIPPAGTIQSKRIGICINPDRPICIAQPHIPEHNRFSSEEFIPGNVIIGSIAQQYPPLAEQDWFDKLLITHALPAAATKPERKAVLPLSLATISKDKEKVIIDLALSQPQKDKALILNVDGEYQSPTYQPDWKDSDMESAKRVVQQPAEKIDHQLKRELIVRTAIEVGENNAKQGALFSLDCISPEKTTWCADIDFSGIDDSETEQAQKLINQVIANGLQGLGKTKATATLELQGKSFYQAKAKNIELTQNYYIITLQTPARLFAAPKHIKATADAASLAECYQQYWAFVSKGHLSLSHYFAQQSKTGGEFYWRHFQPAKNYQVEWLTTAGSVFVLKAGEKFEQEVVKTLLTDWLAQGLPQAEDKQGSFWKNNPNIRQNGFGEIRLNDTLHTMLSIQQQGFKEEWL